MSRVYAMWAILLTEYWLTSMALLPCSDWVDRDNQALPGHVWGPVLWGCRAGVYVGDQLPNPWLEAGSVGHGDADGPGCCLHMVCMGHDVQQWRQGSHVMMIEGALEYESYIIYQWAICLHILFNFIKQFKIVNLLQSTFMVICFTTFLVQQIFGFKWSLGTFIYFTCKDLSLREIIQQIHSLLRSFPANARAFISGTQALTGNHHCVTSLGARYRLTGHVLTGISTRYSH
jgi:hypothetical protein